MINNKLPLTGMLLPLATIAYVADAEAKNSQPNILVILTDDMGFSDIGCYGGLIETPNLDKLAANGLRYTQFYNTARSCPSRASLLTGLHPHQTGIGHMTDTVLEEEGYTADLNNHCVTMAQVLRPAGYETFAVGKWHVSHNLDSKGAIHNWPIQRGFEHFYGTINGVRNYYDPSLLCRQNTLITPFNDPEYKCDNYYMTNALGDNAVSYLDSRDEEKPFFMYLAFTAAHWPMQAMEEDIKPYIGKFDEGWDELRQQKLKKMIDLGIIDPKWGISHDDTVNKWEDIENKPFELRCMEVYAAMVTCMDRNVGKIVEHLREQGELDNTIIMFLQDNGGCAEMYGRHTKPQITPVPEGFNMNPMSDDELQYPRNPFKTRDGRHTMSGYGAMPGPDDVYVGYGKDWAHCSNTPFKEYKHWIHEGGISTPLIVHWPDGIEDKGALRSQPGQLMDIMATCVDVANAKYPKSINGEEIYPCEGMSLTKSFASAKKPSPNRELYWEHESNFGVRIGDWKAVYKKVKGKLAKDVVYSDWELYNMNSDRCELNNLAVQYPDRLKKMVGKWDEYAIRCKIKPFPEEH